MEERVHPPKVTFKYVRGDNSDIEFDPKERYAFWDSLNTISWFKSNGYTLYRRRYPSSSETYPVLPCDAVMEAHYPYAHYDEECWSEDTRLLASDDSGKIAFAQDSLGRHVAIKLVRAETDEFRILQFLSTQSMDILRENCVIPVLDMLPIEGFCFVVMPRWGSEVYLPKVRYLHEVITIMRSILKVRLPLRVDRLRVDRLRHYSNHGNNIKGLAFLHENGIAHHDIAIRNVLVNHFSDVYHLLSRSETRPRLQSEGRLLYAVFDFDYSVLIPPGVKKGEFRLPYQRSWGTFNMNHDTSAGEFDYDPFVFDVGTLGVEFCKFFQNLTPEFPMLAPLLDMMTTRHLDRRFTASQALQFLEEAMPEISESQLNAPITILKSEGSYLEYDRWLGLSPAFVEKWKHFKETPVPWYTAALRRACNRRYLWRVILWTRWFFFRLLSPVHAIQFSFVPRIAHFVSLPRILQGLSDPHTLFAWLSLSRGLNSN